MLFWQTCGKNPSKVQNFSIKLPDKYILFKNNLFSSKHSYGHLDAVLSKLAKRYWRNPKFTNQSPENLIRTFFWKIFSLQVFILTPRIPFWQFCWKNLTNYSNVFAQNLRMINKYVDFPGKYILSKVIKFWWWRRRRFRMENSEKFCQI